MISFNYETTFLLAAEVQYEVWVKAICMSEGYALGSINYIFCDDTYLLHINQTYLQHDTYTDIITFDNTEGTKVSGDIYISIERVQENSSTYEVSFDNELQRVMSHGLLHMMGFKDKGATERTEMREKEEEKIKLFHVEH